MGVGNTWWTVAAADRKAEGDQEIPRRRRFLRRLFIGNRLDSTVLPLCIPIRTGPLRAYACRRTVRCLVSTWREFELASGDSESELPSCALDRGRGDRTYSCTARHTGAARR